MPRRNCQSRRIMRDTNPSAACPEGLPLIVRTMRPISDDRSGARTRLPPDRITPTIRVIYPAESDLTPKPMKIADTIMLAAAGQPNDTWTAALTRQGDRVEPRQRHERPVDARRVRCDRGHQVPHRPPGYVERDRQQSGARCIHSAALRNRDAGRIRNSTPKSAHATSARKSPAAACGHHVRERIEPARLGLHQTGESGGAIERDRRAQHDEHEIRQLGREVGGAGDRPVRQHGNLGRG